MLGLELVLDIIVIAVVCTMAYSTNSANKQDEFVPISQQLREAFVEIERKDLEPVAESDGEILTLEVNDLQGSENLSSPEPTIKLPTVEPVVQAIVEVSSVTKPSKPKRRCSSKKTTKKIVESKGESELNLDTLPLRTARKVAKALTIQQKINGKDASVSWLRAQIKQRLQEEPKIIEVIKEAISAA